APRAPAALTLSAPRPSRGPGGCLSNPGGCGERSGGCVRRARSSLLRRAFRHASSVVAALAALAPRLVRLARHDYSDRLLAPALPRGTAALGCRGDARGGVVIELWAMGREGEVVAQLMPGFERRHPGLRVRVQQIPWSAAHEKLVT